jgi:hypothetical protein
LSRPLTCIAVLVTAFSIAIVATAGASHERVFGVQDCTKAKVEPKRIVFACGDFGLYANHFDWKHWGARKARTSGVLHAKVCKPDCASGFFKDYPVKLVLRHIRHWRCGGKSGLFYKKIKFSFPGKSPNVDLSPYKEVFCT